MRTLSVQRKIGRKDIDKGNHANWLAQLRIAQDVHSELRAELGIGLKALKEEHGLFLVVGKIENVTYRRQLRLGDIIEVETSLWASRRTTLKCHCVFRKDDQIATEIEWLMPLVSVGTERPCRIPQWMTDTLAFTIP